MSIWVMSVQKDKENVGNEISRLEKYPFLLDHIKVVNLKLAKTIMSIINK